MNEFCCKTNSIKKLQTKYDSFYDPLFHLPCVLQTCSAPQRHSGPCTCSHLANVISIPKIGLTDAPGLAGESWCLGSPAAARVWQNMPSTVADCSICGAAPDNGFNKLLGALDDFIAPDCGSKWTPADNGFLRPASREQKREAYNVLLNLKEFANKLNKT